MFLAISDEIVQGEAIVRGDEVDTGPRPSTLMIKGLPGSAEPFGERRSRRFAAPEISNGVAEFIVPLGPAGREGSHLITAGAAIPRLGNQFDSAENRILAHGF